MFYKKIALAMCISTLGFIVSVAPTYANEKEGIVTVRTLNVRSGPNTGYSVVSKVYKGNKVEILESSNGWNKIKLANGNTGWSSGSYIKETANNSTSTSNTSDNQDNSANSTQENISTGKYGKIAVSALNVRSGSSTSYGVITKAYRGNTVEVLEDAGGWVKIKLSNGKIGWSNASYINLSSTSSDSVDTTSSSNNTNTVIGHANNQLGKPYSWGASGPNSFDCSGLTSYVYGQVGVSLPRTSREQYNVGKSVSKSELIPGDLIFTSTDGSGNITHVGIYVGDGYMIHSPKPGDVVKKTSINSTYYQKAYVGAKRVL